MSAWARIAFSIRGATRLACGPLAPGNDVEAAYRRTDLDSGGDANWADDLRADR